ncbi:hypothetical protein GCK72_018894 [Caenorhabditis remanei]|uniref:Acyl_transf_3 domain-containing protein n=1 Tax=Caenorhabditis remanei TaxID=31234 RepID=A0A6A5GBA8_CAERE|nr:hypothetical protein GCK72_018894 [Caenorhabditis remanei]KAF1752340.1 hypothetical protein GCK72_018894 [Caenorhabditis remanei]
MSAGNKLQSLQGLRGISIILVLIFHLFPKSFANGFVGVDMFFVLSGYLMTRILSKEFTLQSVVNFYKKRFSRIVPLYYFTILATILGVLCLVLKSERTEFLQDIKWCLSLLSNYQPIFEHHSYWDQISTIRFLTHLWSLATELQYYLMVPIIHFIASNLPFFNRILAYSLAILILFFFQLLTPFELSYCFLASRVWQFLLGSVAFELSQKNDEVMDLCTEKKRKEEKFNVIDGFPYLLLAIITTVVTFPWIFGEHSTRLIMSLSAAVLCFLCGKLENSFLTLQPLVFIGDISYATYLIHWPVIKFFEYIQQKDNIGLNAYEATTAVLVVFALSLLCHYALERTLLRLDFYVNFTISVFVIGICLSLYPLVEHSQCFAIETLPDSTIEKIEFNFNSSNIITETSELECDYNETTVDLAIDKFGIEYCSHKSNGTGIIMVIGNSLAIRAFSTIFNLFDGQYEEIRLFAKHGGAPLLEMAPYYNQAVLDMAEEINPDLIWIVQGMNEIHFNKLDSIPNDLDEVVQSTMNKFKKMAKLIYVDLPYYVINVIPSNIIGRSLIFRKDIDENLSISLEKVAEQVRRQTDRLLGMNCSNCYFNDIQKALTNDQDAFYLYEKESYKSLVYDGSHLSTAGYEYLKPLYQKRIDRFYEMLNSERNFGI